MEAHNTLVSDIMDEMDPRVLEFIKSHITTFTRWDMLKFFHENANTHDTAENLARFIGRAPDLVRREADNLADEGVLHTSEQGGQKIYAITQDRQIRQIIADLVKTSRERTFRMKLVYHILRAGGQQ